MRWMGAAVVGLVVSAGCASEEQEPTPVGASDAATSEQTDDASAPDAPTVPSTPDTAGADTPEPLGEPTPLPTGAASRTIGPEGACGTPTAVEGLGLRRLPYLQSVTATSARIVWTMTDGQSARARFAEVGGRWQEVAATARVYPTSETQDLVDYTAFDATLTGLRPGTVVCYELFVDDALVVARGALETAWTDTDRPVQLIAVGDSGNGSDDQIALAAQMAAVEADVFLHLGDMAYGDGTFVEFETHMFDIYASILQRIPMWPTPGNHEYKTGIATPYIEVYYLPEQAYRQTEHEYYYSFDYGDVHFVSLDSNDFRYVTLFGQEPGSMTDWLRDDLANTDATWRVAFMHHPVYSSGLHGGTPWLLDEIVPLLEEGEVDLVLVGHDHHYERTQEILANEVAAGNPLAVTYIVAGAGGAGLRDAPGDWFTDVVNDQAHTFLHLEFDGCQATGRAISSEGVEVDRFVLEGCD